MRRRLLLIEARQEALFRRAEPFDNLRISDVVKAVMKYKRLRESSYFCSFAKWRIALETEGLVAEENCPN